jgi:RNA polymerase sigma-70 factor, ECF subfamily
MTPIETAPPAAPEAARPIPMAGLESFESLVERYQHRVYGFLRQMGPNEPDAQDLTQDTFIKAFRSLSRFQPVYSFSTWIFTIARRTAANHFRDRRLTEELPEDLDAGHDDPSVALEKRDRSQRLWHTAQRLKPGYYEVLWLQYGEGFSIEETARVMGRSPLYVRVLLHRARNQLAKLLKKRFL